MDAALREVFLTDSNSRLPGELIPDRLACSSEAVLLQPVAHSEATAAITPEDVACLKQIVPLPQPVGRPQLWHA